MRGGAREGGGVLKPGESKERKEMRAEKCGEPGSNAWGMGWE